MIQLRCASPFQTGTSRTSLWVGDEVAGVELADVRGHVVKGLTGARAADHEDV